jgi:hypothetical protein
LRHAKDPYFDVEVPIVGKITDHFSPTVTHFPPRDLSRSTGRGGARRCNWEHPKQDSTISLIAAVHAGATASMALQKKKKNEKKKQKKMKKEKKKRR